MLPIFLSNQQQSSLVIRLIRILRIIIHTVYGGFLGIVIMPTATARQRNWIVSHWSRSLLKLLNIELTKHGEMPDHDAVNTMFVGNHISWIDIHALNSVRAVRFIAKSDLKSWPIFGWLAKKCNTLFIEREQKKDAVRIIEEASASLKRGDCLCYFPEGTTTDGSTLLAFKGSLMQAPINAGATIWPFAIHYPNTDGSANTEMAFAGETTLVESIWRIVSLSSPKAVLTFLPKIHPQGHERRGLTIAARHSIATQLGLGHHLD
ncbi:lysophospholipid acyltransferase family protein [Candidatus Methylopumilus turicensis]|uniref:Phospholipid/glycerol acyltransferase n=1 Tax=Candidatus Methylopumilus turicensis TaxID=1581680 RepID=A0A0B7IWD7_9PROT|nr:lysophospholipid acyltransferase family protein [Candidatus Methylopumilus turicensis]CEN55407.1 Phospholipid/glycerol acyltransferase [Candidatus Methylopumilus turicensis]